MPIDTKYGRVDVENGTIGQDEAVVVFRGQDRLLPQVLDFYHDLCAREGSPEHHLAAIVEARGHVERWQADNATKTPESAAQQPSSPQ